MARGSAGVAAQGSGTRPADTVGRVTVAARAKGLTKTYGSGDAVVTALDGVDFEIVQGEFTAIMGPSGSGKSTLMHLMAALDTPTSGEVWFGDTAVGSLADTPLTKLRRERVGFYNTFVGRVGDARLPEGVRVDADPASGDINLIAGPHYRGIQFHAESILTEHGYDLIHRLARELLV